ncbi:MAG TPA: hypothetical protein VF120_08155 [Ktedonobacterales bacterium]
MRENSRRTIARAKSRRASARELREAKFRIKEIEEELRDVPLLPETTHGEERDARYARVLKLRALREEFELSHPYDKRPHANGMLLSLVLVVASFLLCAATGLTSYGVYRLLTTKPDPVATATNFWNDIQTQQYADAHANFFAPTLRVQQARALFVQQAQQTDTDYGTVTAAALVGQQVDANTATLTYKVTRTLPSGKPTVYDDALTLELFQGSWGVSDLGATIDPSLATNPPPNPSSPTPTVSPTAKPKK